MHDSIANDDISKLDLSKVAALQQKRTLAFVNHFVTTTVQFLNSFMKRCDQKLMNFERKLEKVEASMVLLEARLSSIPEINTSEAVTKTQDATEATNTNQPATTSDPSEPQVANAKDQEPTEESAETSKEFNIPPEYERFVKMVQVGVPLQAVKLKAGIEGLDTDLLEKILSK